ncbi:MAG TPA: hypothetical protein VIS72_06470 [Anaerolineales bacterium]
MVNGFDAVLVLMSVALNSDVQGNAGDMYAERTAICSGLLSMNESQKSVQGVVNSLYFEPSRNIIRAPRFGIYRS